MFGRYVAAITLAAFILLMIGGAVYDTAKNGDMYRQMNNAPVTHGVVCDPHTGDCDLTAPDRDPLVP